MSTMLVDGGKSSGISGQIYDISGYPVQAGLEASPAGGGGWAGAREACTAAPDGGRLSVVRCTEVMLTLRSWVGLSHVL